MTKLDGRSLRHRSRKSDLLAAAAEYVLDNGMSGLSLRPLAEHLGVSHASLLHHFSSKDQLLESVIEHVRASLADRRSEIIDDLDGATVAHRWRAAWNVLREAREQRQFLLLFQIAGDSAWVAKHRATLQRSLYEEWLLVDLDQLVAEGWKREEALVVLTVLLAQLRGLLLDFLITGDRARVDAAFETGLALLNRPHAAKGPIE